MIDLGIAYKYVNGDLVKIYAAESESGWIISNKFIGEEKYAMWVIYVKFNDKNQGEKTRWYAYTPEKKKIPLVLFHKDIHDVKFNIYPEIAEEIIRERKQLKIAYNSVYGAMNLLTDS
jgi:hypothetical protein